MSISEHFAFADFEFYLDKEAVSFFVLRCSIEFYAN